MELATRLWTEECVFVYGAIIFPLIVLYLSLYYQTAICITKKNTRYRSPLFSPLVAILPSKGSNQSESTVPRKQIDG